MTLIALLTLAQILLWLSKTVLWILTLHLGIAPSWADDAVIVLNLANSSLLLADPVICLYCFAGLRKKLIGDMRVLSGWANTIVRVVEV